MFKHLLDVLPATWGAGCAALGLLLLGGCAESLYLTTPIPINDDRYQFIAPYCAEVENEITVSFVQGAAVKDSSDPTGQKTIPGPTTAAIGVIPVPVSRAYLYMSKNPFFNDAVNVTVGNDCLLTSSDSSSAQQVSAILTELGQTAGGVLSGAFKYSELLQVPGTSTSTTTTWDAEATAAQGCMAAIRARAPIFKKFPFDGKQSYQVYTATATNTKTTTTTTTKGSTTETTTGKQTYTIRLVLDIPNHIPYKQAIIQEARRGLVSFYPVPVIATLHCITGTKNIILSAPQIVNLYLDSDFIDPQRDFLTNPQDTLSQDHGVFTGHKFSDQSSVKTGVDIVTALPRALMPSVTQTTNTQVVTGGGKPSQTTTTTGATISPSKAGP
jgi:hypothetical protein